MPMILLDGFPTQVDDRKLAEITQAVLETISKRVEDVDVWLPELKLAVFQAGVIEMGRRETSALRATTDLAARRALQVALAALFVSLVSLVVALVR